MHTHILTFTEMTTLNTRTHTYSIFASVRMYRLRLIVGCTAIVRLVPMWSHVLLLVAAMRGCVEKWRSYGLRVTSKVGGAGRAHAAGRPGHLLLRRLPPLVRIIVLRARRGCRCFWRLRTGCRARPLLPLLPLRLLRLLRLMRHLQQRLFVCFGRPSRNLVTPLLGDHTGAGVRRRVQMRLETSNSGSPRLGCCLFALQGAASSEVVGARPSAAARVALPCVTIGASEKVVGRGEGGE